MPPPPRRSSGAGKGRGRGARGTERRFIENINIKTTKRERGSSSTKRIGGGGSSAVSSSSTTACSRPTRAVTAVLKKLVVRNIPPIATDQEVRELLLAHGMGHEFVWRFVPGQKRSNNRAPMPGRLYLDMKKDPEKARKLITSLHGQFFYPDAKDAKPLDVEFAPFQKIPREKQRKDAKVGTIDRDPEYLSFLEELSKPKDVSELKCLNVEIIDIKLPSAEAAVDMAEGETLEKPVAALVKYLNERKIHSRDKGKVSG
ncbi:hypothetical protein PsorP6_009556 [Peronosclerospora sorghi]|uniref:Uncharacterized protein n=1 Tax=Peronosclerospora sorghi TaxID=230839 RepID=A0ACC0VZD8_9STRA|nr:hypothetical protein PsorP6_009556 [Peronosclerospora sorghi]